jgi:hypothetical protein
VTVEKTDRSVSCPKCAFHNEARAQSCERCGAHLVKYCPRCGTELELRMRFCDMCGANHADLSSPDGRCQWCGMQSAPDFDACEGCDARLITSCPRCGIRMKAGLNYCASCGLNFEELIQDDEE